MHMTATSRFAGLRRVFLDFEATDLMLMHVYAGTLEAIVEIWVSTEMHAVADAKSITLSGDVSMVV